MGKVKYINEVRALFRKSPVVGISSLKRIMKGGYAYLMVNKLVKKGEVKRITKGYYSLQDDPTLAVFCFKPAYIGLQDALSIHGLWEQETIPIILTTRTVRQGIRTVFGSNVLIRTLPKEYFFGIDYVEQGGLCIPVSDVEKTFIDMIYFNLPMDRNLIKRSKMDITKLRKYLAKYPEEVRKRVRCVVDV